VKEGSFYGTRRKPQVNRPTRLDNTDCFANGARSWSDALEGLSLALSNDATTAFAGDADSLFDQLLHKRRSSDTCVKRKATPARMFYPAQYTTIPVPCMFTVLSKATNPFQIQHFLRPDGIRKAIYNVLSLATLEKRNQKL
jgi:hypothetical protein